MNKLFSKIGVAIVGMAMAIGVGVAVGNNNSAFRVDATDVTNEEFTFTSNANANGQEGWSTNESGGGSSYLKLKNGEYLQYELIPNGNALTTDVTIDVSAGTFGGADRTFKVNAELRNSSNQRVGNTATTDSISNSSEGTYRFNNATLSAGDAKATVKYLYIYISELGSGYVARLKKVKLSYSYSEVGGVPSVSVSGQSGPYYTSTASITLTASPSNITPASYSWEITSGGSHVTPGATNNSQFVLTPVSAGTVEGTLTVSDNTDSPSCNWSITIQEVAVSSVSWGGTTTTWLTNTSFNRAEFGTITVTYNDGSNATPSVSDENVTVYAKTDGDYAVLSSKMFTAAGNYTVKVRYGGKDSGTKSIKVGNNSGTIAYAKGLMSANGSGSNNVNWVGTYTTTVGAINQAPANAYGNLYLGDEYNGSSTADSVYLYTCSDYGPVSGYEDLVKGGCLSVSGTLQYYKSQTPEIINYTVVSFYKYNGLSVQTAPTKTTYYEGETFDPTGTVLSVAYSNSTSRNITSGYTYDLTGQLIGTGNQTVTFTYIENGFTKTCTQTINVLANPYTLTISENTLTMSEYSSSTAITLTPSQGFGNDYIWEDVVSSDSDVVTGSIGQNDVLTISSGVAGVETLTFEVYTSDLLHSASVTLTVTVAAGSVVLSSASVTADIRGGAEEITVTLANFESVPNFSFTGGNDSYFTIAASEITRTSAKLTITPVAVHAAMDVTVNVRTTDEYQSGSAVLSVAVKDTATTISLSGTDFTDFNGQTKLVPDNWVHSGAEKFDTTKTVFKGAANYLENDLLIPATGGDSIYAVIAQVYSVSNTSSSSNKNTMKLEALKDGEVLETAGASATFVPHYANVSNASAVETACSDANSKWVLVYGTGMNGIKFSFDSKKSNWVVNEVRLFYLTQAEYNFAIALGDSAMQSICTAGQSRTTPSDDLSSLWSTLVTNYSSLSTPLGDYVYATSGTKAANHILDVALTRYNYICDKYSTLDNFLGRTIIPTQGSKVVPNFNQTTFESNELLVLIIAISATALVAVGGYFFIRRRKHD